MVNRMLSVFIAGAVMIGSSQLCLAVLGETEAELEARYGKPFHERQPGNPLAEGDTELVFRKDGYAIVVYIWHGRSAREMYVFPDGKGGALLVSDVPEKVAALLEANAQGSSFKPNPGASESELFLQAWDREDGKAYAQVRRADPRGLEIATADYVDECANRVIDEHRRR
jgi:hypothetical protein